MKRAGVLAIVVFALTGSAAAARPPITAEGLLAVDVPASTVQHVAGGTWWPGLPAFDTTVYRSNPKPAVTTGVTYTQIGGSSTVVTSLYAFDSAAKSLEFLRSEKAGAGPLVDEKHPALGDGRVYYTTTLPGAIPATRLYFTRGLVGVSIELAGRYWSATKVGALAKPIDLGLQKLLAGTFVPPPVAASDLAHMPPDSAAPGPVLGTAAISAEAWATVDRDGTPAQNRARLSSRGAKLTFRRYLRRGSTSDAIETTLFTFPTASAATSWAAPFVTGVKKGKDSVNPGATGPESAYRASRNNYELRFAVGRYVGDVFCYAPYADQPSPACAAAVRTTAERWFAQLSRAE